MCRTIGESMGNVYTAGYSEAGGSHKKRSMRDFDPVSASPAEDIDFNNLTLRQRSRMLYMSGSVGTSAINTVRTKVVGTGLTLKAEIGREFLGVNEESAKDWQRRVEAEFRLWADRRENCDALGLSTFYGLEQLVLKSWLLSGDVFVLFKYADPTPMNPYTLRLHVIEADRISTPVWCTGKSYWNTSQTEGKVPEGKPGAGNAVHDGVEVDGDGRIVAYYICDRYPQSMLYSAEKAEWVRVEAFGRETGLPNILHITEGERPDQYRGVPYLTPVVENILQLRRYTESELMAALVQSFFTAWVETEADTNEFPLNDTDPGGGLPESEEPESENEYRMGPGTVLHLRKGEKVQFGSPNIPTVGFDVFVKTISRTVGAALEMPYEVLLKEFTSSYSASRGALLEAWEAFRMRRSWLVEAFCRPVYERWLTEAVAVGRVQAPGFFADPLLRSAWCGAQWIGPVQGQLDPKKEAEAALALASYGVKTYQQITREFGGGDFMANAEELKRENDALEAAGAIEYEIPDTTDPSDLDAKHPEDR